jgi:hypothetical protein
MIRLPRVEEGDPVTDTLWNALIDAARRCNVEPGPGLHMDENPDGVVLSALVVREFYAKITGAISGGTYPWTEQFPAASGTWTAGTRTGVAYERNGNTTVPSNTYVTMKWTVAGFYEFVAGSC